MAAQGDSYLCSNCGNEIGKYYAHPTLKGLFLLDRGGALDEYTRCLCKQCGSPVHFSLNTQLAARLFRVSIKEAEEMREKPTKELTKS